MKTLSIAFVAGTLLAPALAFNAPVQPNEKRSGCIECHQGIEFIRQPGAEMLEEILDVGRTKGDPDGCVVCHGGDPAADEKEIAHQGKAFYPDPGSPWVNKKTCGRCHPDHTRVQWSSLMMTEAGKIQGVAWAFGSLTGYEHKWGNYDFTNPEDTSSRLGTDVYRAYMEHLKTVEPNVFVDRHERLPDAPTDLSKLADQPDLAVFTYLRNQCLRCHHAVKGRHVRGDYRGMGCSSCHIPYGNEGFYEGDDKTIARDEPGHSLVHTIQATREAKVTVHGHEYSGIPVETCTTCHDRGKRIGVSFQGLMETSYTSPYTEDGQGQPALHTKHYIAMHQDIHYQKGMTCQDCHTSIDVHGDGFLAAANLGSVQIECSDCHGTPKAYPWELPQGYMDEYGSVADDAPPRGTAAKLTSHVRAGTQYPAEEGYLLTARGNPFSNAVRKGNKVIVHTAAGADIELRPLKLIETEKTLSLAGLIAMDTIESHVGRMECYTCHTAWAPQCYGCHVKIDYSADKTCFDWLGAGHQHAQAECAADRGEGTYETTIPGQIEEQRSFLRWEDPPMGVNGEGRITPVSPGCQVSATIIGPDGKPILLNHIFRTTPGSEGSGPEGQLSLDMSPTQPHTMTKQARTCESCHASEKSLGYGIDGGRPTRRPDQRVVVDLETVDGHILSERSITQMAAVEGLTDDWSRFVTEDGQQLQTVGHHFSGSRPLNNRERLHIDRRGVCLSCHQEVPDRSLAVNLLHHVAKYTGQLPETPDEHDSLIHKILLLSAWIQVAVAGAAPLAVAVGAVWYWRRRRRSVALGQPPADRT